MSRIVLRKLDQSDRSKVLEMLQDSKATNEFIGFCGIKNIDGILDFCYFFIKSFWGQRLATEACKLVIKAL